jgi:hypothetical protein
MSQKGTTKDEMMMIKLYEMAMKLGGTFEEVDKYAIGRAIGQNDKGTNIIARDLAGCNFIKKGTGDAILLTQHGLNLVESLLQTK